MERTPDIKLDPRKDEYLPCNKEVIRDPMIDDNKPKNIRSETHRNPELKARLPLITSKIQDAIPTAQNFIMRSEADKNCVKNLLRNKQLIPRPDLKQAYLEFFTIPNKDGSKARPLVNGKEAQTRGIICPKYSLSLSVPDTCKKVLQHKYFYQADLAGAYGQVWIEDEPLLTVRIDGRIFQFISPPQGLSSSPAVCCDIFEKVFKLANFDSSYVDNAIGGADTLEKAEAQLKEAKTVLAKYFNLNNTETSETPVRSIEFLGLIISHQSMTLPANKVDKLKRLLDQKDVAQINGYYSYLSDLFGITSSTKPDKISRTFGTTLIYADGAKNLFSAAVAFCGSCNKIQDILQQKCRQDSQMTSELKAALLGERLRKKFLTPHFFTDSMSIVENQRSGHRNNSLCSLIANNIGLVKHVKSEDNWADPYSRELLDKKSIISCSC